MNFSNTRPAELGYASISADRSVFAFQALQDALKVMAVWGQVLVLRLECAVLRFVLGAIG